MSLVALLLVASQLFHHLPRQSLKELRKPDSLQALVVLTHLGAHVYNGFSLGPRVVDVMRDRAKQEKAEGKSCTDADVSCLPPLSRPILLLPLIAADLDLALCLAQISPALKHLNSEFKMLHGRESSSRLYPRPAPALRLTTSPTLASHRVLGYQPLCLPSVDLPRSLDRYLRSLSSTMGCAELRERTLASVARVASLHHARSPMLLPLSPSCRLLLFISDARKRAICRLETVNGLVRLSYAACRP